MNRYISYSALVFVAAFAAACSSSEDMTGNEATGSESSNVPMTILGVKGNGVVNTGVLGGADDFVVLNVAVPHGQVFPNGSRE